MTGRVASDAEVIREASEVLLRHLSPAKAARFWAIWRTGQGDCLQWRDDAFAGESVDSLYEQIEQYQTNLEDECYGGPGVPCHSPVVSFRQSIGRTAFTSRHPYADMN